MDITAQLEALNEATTLEWKECPLSGQLTALSLESGKDYWICTNARGQYWLTEHHLLYEVSHLIPSLTVLIAYLQKKEGVPVGALMGVSNG